MIKPNPPSQPINCLSHCGHPEPDRKTGDKRIHPYLLQGSHTDILILCRNSSGKPQLIYYQSHCGRHSPRIRKLENDHGAPGGQPHCGQSHSCPPHRGHQEPDRETDSNSIHPQSCGQPQFPVALLLYSHTSAARFIALHS